MKYLAALFLITIINITAIHAQYIEGRVSNGESLPLSNVSVYLKNTPFVKTFTDKNGEFVLSLEGIKYSEDDKIVVSHIGYETKEYQIKKMRDSIYHEIILIESSILLQDVNVMAQKKRSRKETKKWKMSVIEEFKKQLEVDFVFEDRTYKVASDLEVVRDSKKIIYNKLIGEYKELIGILPKKTDSISFHYTDIENYLDTDIELGLKKMSDKFIDNNVVSKRRKENKRMLDSTFYKTLLTDSVMIKEMISAHKSFWYSSRDMKKMRLDDDLKKWEIIEGDEQTILRYKDKRGILGIVKHVSVSNFIIDPYTYSLERFVGEVSAELNIPFGYKLPPDALMLLNVIHVSGEEMKKYRVRHLHVDAVFNTIYKKIDASKYADEKNFDLKMSLTDTKKRNIKIDSKVLVKVLSIENN